MDAWEIDAREEGHVRRNVGVFVATVDLETVYAVFMGALLQSAT
jgi:hypothetical protein